MGALLKVIVVAVLAVILQRAFRVYKTWGGYARHYEHYPGPCRKVEGVQPGSEGFHTLSNGQTFITSGLRYEVLGQQWLDFWERHSVKGRIYLMDLNDPEIKVTDLKISSTPDFNVDTFAPHGISIWEDKKDGRHTVFVVNHPFREPGNANRVEKFEYDPVAQELLHQASFSDPSMTLMNDVQATGENSFYFTNSNYFFNLWLQMVEMILELPLTSVVHFNGSAYVTVDSGLRSPNGVIMSPDGKFVYVAHMISQEIAVYKRDATDNSLTRVQTYPLNAWPDNMLIDENTGRLFLALHPVPYQLFAYAVDMNKLAPSQVLQLALEDGQITDSRELFYDDGELIRGSSTAIVHNGTLLIGSPSHNLVTCNVYVPLL